MDNEPEHISIVSSIDFVSLRPLKTLICSFKLLKRQRNDFFIRVIAMKMVNQDMLSKFQGRLFQYKCTYDLNP